MQVIATFMYKTMSFTFIIILEDLVEDLVEDFKGIHNQIFNLNLVEHLVALATKSSTFKATCRYLFAFGK